MVLSRLKTKNFMSIAKRFVSKESIFVSKFLWLISTKTPTPLLFYQNRTKKKTWRWITGILKYPSNKDNQTKEVLKSFEKKINQVFRSKTKKLAWKHSYKINWKHERKPHLKSFSFTSTIFSTHYPILSFFFTSRLLPLSSFLPLFK